MTVIPETNEVWFPKGHSKGTYAIVTLSVDDKVVFVRHDEGQKDREQTVRLSTFLSRFEPSGFTAAGKS